MKKWKEHRGLLKLVGIVVMVPLVAWFFGFRQTVQLWRECESRQETISRLSVNEPGKVTCLPENEVTGKQVLNNGVLLERIGKEVESNGVKIVKYTPYLTREEGRLLVHTGELVLSGNFVSLLRVMHRVEIDEGLGRIVSVGFRLFRDRAKKERQLRMTLVVQQLTVS
ncbi:MULTISPECIES: hypothetical protein [unclassified Butyricimonas]|uniref:hypothetical protein n=1 Tax=unclassified Butyricimonas TaxID=2637652 RepID=UPI000C079BF7|nr:MULTISPECIES: hypothetical protein [unclassified Butyricimonas]